MSNFQDIKFHLVDDNDIDIAVNSKLLQLAQFSEQIYTYNNAVKFLEAIGSDVNLLGERNVILLDIMMPQLNGFDCLDKLELMPEVTKSKLYVFMLSSSIDRNDIRRAEAYKMVQKVLEKPLDIYLLKKFLEEIFEV